MVKMKDPSTDATLFVAEDKVEKFETMGFVRVRAAEKKPSASKTAAKK